jgi:hypothetical protein
MQESNGKRCLLSHDIYTPIDKTSKHVIEIRNGVVMLCPEPELKKYKIIKKE